jgi:predicted ATPase/DNA-binding SARP family transcriptional activator
MEFRILGSLEVEASDGSPLRVSGPKRRCLLALLLIHANQVLSVDRIIDSLWGDKPPSEATNTLRFQISKLRSVLGQEQDRLATRKPGYVLRVGSDELDSHRFESAVTEAASILDSDPEAAVARYRAALELWRGPALVDFEYEDFARTEIARLEELRLAALEGRFEAELAAGRHDELVGELRSQVDEHPLRERLWASLMTSLYRSGRQSEALRAFQQARSTLGDELGIEPSEELRSLEEKVLLQDESIKTPEAPRRTHNLPARVSHFVGREKEIATVAKLLRRSRLVTLMGVGGVGKTSLALELAIRRVDEHADGVWLADLASTQGSTPVLVAVAEALGVRTRSEERILSDVVLRMADANALLVLDNCEHVIDPAAELAAELLAKCPGVRILATSRELLGVPGEVTFGVPPLSLADDGEDGEAVALFLERVMDHSPLIEVSIEERQTVRGICRTLDGLPLAIELAAARTRTLPFEEVERRLSDRFALLAGGSRTAPARQRTLRATVDWSFDLLRGPEKRLFGALSLFPGTFTAAAAEAVANAEGQDEGALNLLSALVDKSLVVRAGDRYLLLPTLRRYGAEKVNGEALAVLRRAVVDHFVAVAVELETRLFATDGGKAARQLAEERSNFRIALAWAIEAGDTEAALQLAAALALHWSRSGVWTEEWLRRVASTGEDVPQTVQLREGLLVLEGVAEPADALLALGELVAARGERLRATRLLGAADQLRQDLDQESPQSETDLAIDLEEQLGSEVFEQAWHDGHALISE